MQSPDFRLGRSNILIFGNKNRYYAHIQKEVTNKQTKKEGKKEMASHTTHYMLIN